MTFCSRCGELNCTEKCIRCGVLSGQSVSVQRPSVDRWQSRYLGSIVGLDNLKSPPSSPGQRSPKKILKNSPSLGSTRYIPHSKSPRRPLPTLAIIPPAKMNNCHSCNKKLVGKTVRLPESNVRYHWECLQCTQCHLPFEDTSFYVDPNKSIYHPKCAPSTYTFRSCTRCSLSITDSYLGIQTSVLHLRCFRCTSCQKVLQPSTIYTDLKGTFCQQCTNTTLTHDNETLAQHMKIVPQPVQLSLRSGPLSMFGSSLSLVSNQTGSTTTSACPSPSTSSSTNRSCVGSPPSVPNLVSPAHEVVPPSALMSSRGRPLPRFGTTKTCPGCCQRIVSIHEEKQGPKATRWHIKCLACTRCSKQLDSAATVLEEKTGANPWCSACLLWKKNDTENEFGRSSFLTLPRKPVRIE
ncbi:hypothetical protein J3Q64DRAFT_1864645 [Phycomyces blakesleeanus]|uniref:LIM zinc-binding domain-containing protein n=1 Tax=Phycomyces blakesleeanus TaxID=4837 RepID=A0ABR3AXN8_PHYBL